VAFVHARLIPVLTWDPFYDIALEQVDSKHLRAPELSGTGAQHRDMVAVPVLTWDIFT
jgi:hypothetical protein